MASVTRMVMVIGLVLVMQARAWTADLNDGFSGLKWGMAAADIQDLRKVGSNGKIDYYLDPGIVHTIYGIEAAEVLYGFYEGRFFAAYARLDTLEVFAKIKSDLQSRYGVPKVVYSSRGDPAVYRWKTGNVKIKLKTDESMNKMKLAFYYTPIADRVNEDAEESFREDSLKFLPIERGKTPERLPLLEF